MKDWLIGSYKEIVIGQRCFQNKPNQIKKKEPLDERQDTVILFIKDETTENEKKRDADSAEASKIIIDNLVVNKWSRMH